MASSFAVIGAGSWGSALANVLAAKGLPVTLWARSPEVARIINETHRNPTYLKDIPLDPRLTATSDLHGAISGKEILVLVTPSQVLREVLKKALPAINPNAILVSCSKGIENKTLMTMNEMLTDVLPRGFHERLCFLSGPSFADEVARKMPTAVTVAGSNQTATETVQHAFFTDYFRTFTSSDVVGVELGGALKNVIAIAAGVSDGLNLGHNSRAALITRGLGEIAKLGIKRGASALTFLGLAGMGDLILTCTSELSRNRQVGIELGKGRTLTEILGEMKMVAEGVKTAASVYELAKREGEEMIICEKVYDVLYNQADPRKVVGEIMSRAPRAEFPWHP